MKGSYQVLDNNQEFFWSFRVIHNTMLGQDVWQTETISMAGGIAVPDFQDESEPLLMNTIERWCIINNLRIRPELTLTKEKYDIYHINGEPVFISFKWAVTAKYKRRKSGNTRIEHFEVCSEDREGAESLLYRRFKGASLTQVVSITPNGYGICYWKSRPGFPHIDTETLSRLKMPENL